MNIRRMNSNYFTGKQTSRSYRNKYAELLFMSLNIVMEQTIAYFYAAKEKLIVTCLSIPISYIRMCKFSRVTKHVFFTFSSREPSRP